MSISENTDESRLAQAINTVDSTIQIEITKSQKDALISLAYDLNFKCKKIIQNCINPKLQIGIIAKEWLHFENPEDEAKRIAEIELFCFGHLS